MQFLCQSDQMDSQSVKDQECEIVYDLWPKLPARSQLYHLEPIGVGSPLVESLSGYIARLADAYLRPVRSFLQEQVDFPSESVEGTNGSFLRREVSGIN